jgi:hypothetical protein
MEDDQVSPLLVILVSVTHLLGPVLVRAVSPRLPSAAAGVRARSGHVRFVMHKAGLKQVFSAYFDFPCQFSLNHTLHIHHLVLVQY